MRNTVTNTILEACNHSDDIMIISGDAGLGVFDDFKERHPKRFMNLGIAEQNMIGFAAGLAMTGHRVVVYNIIPFLLYRCYEQVRNDICYQDLPVMLIGVGSGLAYAPMGMTHYAVEDLAIAATLPNLTVISPCDPVEAGFAARYALSSSKPVYLRLAKRGEPDLHSCSEMDISAPQLLRQGERVALVCHGPITEEALKAYDLLAATGRRPLVLSVPMVQPLDCEALRPLLSGLQGVVVVEEHYRHCGLGAALKAELGSELPVQALGLPAGFIHDVLDTAGMRRHFGIAAGQIAETVQRLW